MAYVIQEIFEPLVFYPHKSFSGAKRYKRKANAENIISNYSDSSYLVIEEEKVGEEEHKKLFLEKRMRLEKKKDEAYKQRYSDISFPFFDEEIYHSLAETAWNQFIQEFKKYDQ